MTDQSLSTPAKIWHVDVAIKAWIEAKTRRSGSEKTRKAYENTLTAFRSLLWQTGRDLDPYMNAREDTEEARREAVAEIALAAQGFAGLSVKDKVIAESTYNQRLAILSSFYIFTNKRNFFSCGNPIASVDRSKVQSYKHAQPLEPEEVAQRMRAIDRSIKQGARDYALLAVLF